MFYLIGICSRLAAMATRIRNTEVDEQDAARAFAATLQRNLRFVRDEEKPELAGLLRRKGWSYRRIAEALDTPYNVVSRWLADTNEGGRAAAATGARPRSRRAPEATGAAAAPASGPTDASVSGRIDELAERLDRIVESLEQDRRSARGREERLLTALEELKAAISEMKR